MLRERNLRQSRRIVAEKRGGSFWRVTIYHNYKALSPNVNGSGKVIVGPHPNSDQHQNLTTSRGSVTQCPCLPCLVDIRKRVRELSCSQNDRQTNKQRRSNNSVLDYCNYLVTVTVASLGLGGVIN